MPKVSVTYEEKLRKILDGVDLRIKTSRKALEVQLQLSSSPQEDPLVIMEAQSLAGLENIRGMIIAEFPFLVRSRREQ